MAGSGWATPLRQIRDLFHQGTPAGSSDAQLLARFAERGDGRAFEAIVGRYGPMVAATCRAVLRNEHDAEDAFQATFLVLARKARTVRAGEALGAWLHRVAYRAAVQASVRVRRRRREEAEAGLMAIRSQGGSEEARRLVHEEVDRLPQRHRLPVVLCDLEGLSYLEAAARLGLTEPALRHRLARGRERLRERLEGRGVSAGVVVATLARPLARAVVPLAWTRAAVAAATGTAAPAGAVAIAEILMRGMLMARIKLAGGVLLGASALVAAGVALAGPTAEPPTPAPVAARARARPRGQEEKPTLKPMEAGVREVRGIVLDPDGNPVAGAKVWTFMGAPDGRVETTSGADGRFALGVRALSRFPGFGGWNSPYWMMASAPGFGLGVHDAAARADAEAEQVIRLTPDGVPIEGRLVDQEGRPVVDASVGVSWVYREQPSRNDPAAWVDRVRSGGVSEHGRGYVAIMAGIVARTGPDGRFRLDGVGRDSVALLQFSGPTIATFRAHAMTLDHPEIRVPKPASVLGEELVIHPPRFEIAARPSRPIEGTIRDEETSKPIAGAEIRAYPVNDASAGSGWFKSDANGNYRIAGLPPGLPCFVDVVPPHGSPYLAGWRRLGADAGSGPRAFDLALKRVAIVKGRVVDGATGRPVVGLVTVASFQADPADEHKNSAADYACAAELDAEGGFSVAVPPGRALVLVRADAGNYEKARGHEKIEGYDAETGGFAVGGSPVRADGYNAIVEVRADRAGEAEPLEIRLEPAKLGPGLSIRVVDPEGRPVAGTEIRELGAQPWVVQHPGDSSEFEVEAVDPSRPRRLVVRHIGRKLTGSVLLKRGEPGPIEVKLQPWGTIAGRLVDDEGRPLADLTLDGPATGMGAWLEDSDLLPMLEGVTDLDLWVDGRFRFEGLVPGLKYSLSASRGPRAHGQVFRDRVVGPGEVVDLGDHKLSDWGVLPNLVIE